MFRFVKDSLESLKDLRRFSFCSIVEAILTVGRIKQKYGYLWLVVHLQLVSCLVVGSFVKNTQSQKTVLISCLESHSFFSFYICCCSNLYKESKCPLWFSGQWTVNIVKIEKLSRTYICARTQRVFEKLLFLLSSVLWFSFIDTQESQEIAKRYSLVFFFLDSSHKFQYRNISTVMESTKK